MNSPQQTSGPLSLFLLTGMALLPVTTTLAQNATFEGLGFLPGANPLYSYPVDLSADGTVVVGQSRSPVNQAEAFRWTDATGMVSFLPPGFTSTGATGVSADGNVIAVNFLDVPGFLKWTSADGIINLGIPTALGNGTSVGSTDISDDGQVMVGIGKDSQNNRQPVLWSNGFTLLEQPSTAGHVFAVSGDGSTAVGWIKTSGTGFPMFYAARWRNGAVERVSSAAGSGWARGVSTDGDVVVGQDYRDANVGLELYAFRWTAQGAFTDLGTLGGAQSAAFDVSGDGTIVVGTAQDEQSTVFTGYIWDEINGMRDLKDVLESHIGINLTGWSTLIPTAISSDGTTIVGFSIHNGVQEAWRAVIPRFDQPDTDGDGLLDDWEINGIPYTDSSGEPQRYILDGDGDGLNDANPMHKDLFIEIDVMAGVPFDQDAIFDLEFAFSIAPVSNPDGIPGITLWAKVDESDIPFKAAWNDDWTEFDATKTTHFGTFSELLDAELLAAKAKAFRYCLWVNAFEPSKVVGWAETPGNDLAVAFGGSLPLSARNLHFMASTLMHEIGHTLGLDHGGGDTTNYKPNHVSVMNYNFDQFLSPGAGGVLEQLPVDFCREAIQALNEDDLNETVGVTSAEYANVRTLFSPAGPPVAPQWMTLDGSEVDWNGDGQIELSVIADVNRLGDATAPSPGEPLNVDNEWDLIELAIGDDGDFVDGQHITLPTSELDEATVQWFIDNTPPAPCLSDLDGNNIVDGMDIAALLAQWGTGGSADINGDGIADGVDLAAMLSNWGACPGT